MKFTEFNLDARLQTGITRAGYVQPTPIQAQAIPVALAGGDIIGTAQTGTGKTAAFVLPLLHKLLNGPRRQARALIVTPTRELAEQIHETVKLLATGTGLRSVTIYGGVGARPQAQALRNGAEIIVACPGRLLDLAGQGVARLNKIEVLVLDEADRMFDMGFMPDVRRILNLVPEKRQTLFFSATFPKEVRELAEQALSDPQRVAVDLNAPARTVSHSLYPVNNKAKTGLLLGLLEEAPTNSVLVFTRTKHRAQRVARQLETAGYRVTSLHGNRTQSQRQVAIKGFREGRFQIMVATDIAARGLDIQSISHVINYDMPDTTDAYIHRIGRTGRAERSGEAFTLVTPEDKAAVRTLERVLGKPIERRTLQGFDYHGEPELVAVPAAVPEQALPRGPRRPQRGRRGEDYAKRLASYR